MKKLILATAMTALTVTATAQSSNRPGVLATPGGRYVFGQISEYRSDQYLLDTHTGRLWKFITYCEDTAKKETCKAPVLHAVEFESQPLTDDYYTPQSIPTPAPAAAAKQPAPEPKKK